MEVEIGSLKIQNTWTSFIESPITMEGGAVA